MCLLVDDDYPNSGVVGSTGSKISQLKSVNTDTCYMFDFDSFHSFKFLALSIVVPCQVAGYQI